MFTNYLKIALRNILKGKTYSIINIAGLAIGMSCFILIALYIQHELSFDKFHKNSDKIYRIDLKMDYTKTGSDSYNTTPAPLAGVLKSDYPGIENAARLRKEPRPSLILSGENTFLEDNFFYADPDFLEIFSFPLVTGNPKTALNDPYSIILTEEIAHKYFGDENAVGKTITVNQKHQQQPYVVTGVIKNPPSYSHLHFNFLASFNTLYQQEGSEYQEHSMHWNAAGFYTYIKLDKKTLPQAFEIILVDLVKKYQGSDSKIRYLLEPIERIHLYQNWDNDIDTNGDIRYIYLFAAIGFLILLIACFNYINISTAQSAKRAKEVGLRKVVGANRVQLLKQFLSETIVFSLLGFCISILIVELLLPSFLSFMGKGIQLSIFSDIKMLLSLLGILLFTGCLAGAYPAFLISSYQPTQILKNTARGKSRSIFSFRNALVIFQFIISGVLIFSTITVYNQLHYMLNKKLGLKKDHIVTLNVFDEQLQKNHESFFNELIANPRIKDISASQSLLPGTSGGSNIDWDGRKESDISLMYGIRADRRFAYLYELPVIDGKNYSVMNNSSTKSYFLLNRSALKVLGWKNAIGKRFQWNDTWKENGEVIGVVDDFHFFTLDRKIEPLVIELVGSHLNNWKPRYFSIKISSQDIPGTLSFIEKKWKQQSQYPFQLEFFDKRMDSLYRNEQNLAQLFNFFSLIAILIGCLGLYGLTSSSIEQRIKEIGIRKVLGASISQVLSLLSKETTICILIANVISFPFALYAMNKWLEDFAYRIDISWWIFALSGGIALLIALATVSFQAIKAARANPVESLKYE